MVAYNSQEHIGSAIESFLEQKYPKKELIVIDGLSTDDTCSIVKQYNSPLINLYSERDDGIYDAMNKGLRRVRGDAFGCLNSDDCYAGPGALALIASTLSGAQVVSGRLNFVREHDGSPPVRVWKPEQYQKGAFARGFSLPHPTTYARREVLDHVGEFSTTYRSASDYDWLLRALEVEGFSHTVINEVLVNMRIGGESTNGIRSLINNSCELLMIRREKLNVGIIDTALFANLIKKLLQVKK